MFFIQLLCEDVTRKKKMILRSNSLVKKYEKKALNYEGKSTFLLSTHAFLAVSCFFNLQSFCHEKSRSTETAFDIFQSLFISSFVYD